MNLSRRVVAALLCLTPGLAAAQGAQELIGKTATMPLQIDEEAELEKVLADAGFQAIHPARDLTGTAYPVHRLEVLTGGPASEDGLVTVVVWRQEQILDKRRAQWRITGMARGKIGSEASFTDDCVGNAKDKPLLTFLYHEAGKKGGPAQGVLSAYRLDRKTGRLERVTGKPPACKAIEDPYEG